MGLDCCRSIVFEHLYFGTLFCFTVSDFSTCSKVRLIVNFIVLCSKSYYRSLMVILEKMTL